MLRELKLTDLQKRAIMEAFDHGSISTIKRYGHDKHTVKSLLERGLLQITTYSVQHRYGLTALGFEVAEWLVALKLDRTDDAQDTAEDSRRKRVQKSVKEPA